MVIMHLVVTIRKVVPDRDTGFALFELIKERLTDKPEIEIHGHVTNHFESQTPE